MSRRRPAIDARVFVVPSAGLLLTGAAPAFGTQPWLVVGLVFFGVAAVALLAAVGVKMRRTPGPPPQRPPGEDAPPAQSGARDDGDGTDRPDRPDDDPR